MSVKLITYSGLLNETYYRSKDIDTKDVVDLLKQAQSIPPQLVPFKGIIHVIDYTKKRHVGVSGPMKNILGYSPKEVMENGLEFLVEIFHKDDFNIYNEFMFPKIISTLESIPRETQQEYIFSFTYRLKKPDGNWMHVYQQGTYILEDETQLPIFGIGIDIDITPISSDTTMILSIDRKEIAGGAFNYKNLSLNYYYPDPEISNLTKREREILGWLADGFSSKQIADKLYLSESTVVNHRKNMLKKANVKNVAELIQYGIKKKII